MRGRGAKLAILARAMRRLAVTMAIATALALGACGGDDNSSDNASTTEATTQTTDTSNGKTTTGGGQKKAKKDGGGSKSGKGGGGSDDSGGSGGRSDDTTTGATATTPTQTTPSTPSDLQPAPFKTARKVCATFLPEPLQRQIKKGKLSKDTVAKNYARGYPASQRDEARKGCRQGLDQLD